MRTELADAKQPVGFVLVLGIECPFFLADQREDIILEKHLWFELE